MISSLYPKEPARHADTGCGGSLSATEGYMEEQRGRSTRRTSMKLATLAAISVLTLTGVLPAAAATYDDGYLFRGRTVVAEPMAAYPAYGSTYYDGRVKIGGPGGWVAPPTVPLGQTIPNFVGPTPEGGSPQ
jgi:hypothetical protein